MSIFFLVVALLVAAILLSRLTWWPAWGERRSVKHHEQAMDVLRSLASRRAGSANGDIGAGEHPTISPAAHIGPAAVFDEIAPEASAGAVHEMVRVLKEEPPPGKLPAPPTSLPPAPAAVAPVGPGADEKKATVEPSFVFLAEDSDDDLLAPLPALPSPPSLEDVTRSPSSRSRELVLAVLQMDRPRLGLAFGLITVVVMATVLGTLVALMSGSSNSQRVRQVAAPPTTIAAPAPSPPTTSSPVTTEPPPSTT
ncbi:MAG TPA: hypothetical protein VG476_00860, partial [Acidimicrobiales bacterium]|nr:hypothetical protein [Acidimicrobiales bacterium]